MNRLLTVAALCLLTTPAAAHQSWSNGEEVPEWVKAQCCGKSDAHHLNPSAVHITPEGVRIDGLNVLIPISRVLPSMDGQPWAFWNPNAEPSPLIYCIFLPLNGT